MAKVPGNRGIILGDVFVEGLSLNAERSNLLFAALILTTLGVFVAANLLLLNGEVLLYSAAVALSCIAFVFLFYAAERLTNSLAWGFVLSLSAVVASVVARHQVVDALLLVAFGWASLCVLARLRVRRSEWGALLLMAVMATAAVLGVSRAYTSFDLLPRLHVGLVHQDTLFHASIAAMIKNYGVVSTGLHGLVETPYHALSHALIAGLSRISGQGVLEVYGVATWVVFAPLLIFSVTAVISMLDRSELLSLPLSWASTALLLVLLPRLLSSWGLWQSYFVSESYLVSLSLFLVGFGLLFKRSLRWSDLVLATLLALLISFAKVSVGLIFAGLWFTRFLFFAHARSILGAGAVATTSVAAAVVVNWTAKVGGSGIGILPMHFIASFSIGGSSVSGFAKAFLEGDFQLGTLLLALASIASFWMAHFSVSWFVVGFTALLHGLRGIWRSPMAVYSLAAVAAGSAVVALFAIPGGSAYYFSSVAFFVSLPAVAAWLAFRLQAGVLVPMRNWILLTSVVVIAGFGLVPYYRVSLLGRAASYAEVRSELVEVLVGLRSSGDIGMVRLATPEMRSLNPVERCSAQPFLFPAVSERSWSGLFGASGPACQYWNYGYSQYGLSEDSQAVGIPVRVAPGMQVQLPSVPPMRPSE